MIYYVVIVCYILLISGLYYLIFPGKSINKFRYIGGGRQKSLLKNCIIFLNTAVHNIGSVLTKTPIGKNKRKIIKILEILQNEKGLHITSEAFIGYKSISSFLLLIGGLFAGSSIFHKIIFGILGAITGFFIPDIVGYRFAVKISEDINRELSYFMDLLRISTMSGQNIYNSFSIIIEKYNGKICYYLKNFIRDIDMGEGKDCAYDNLIEKNRSKQYRELISVIREADKYGAPISEIIQKRSEQLNFENLDNAEKKAKKTALLSLFPLILLILPSFILLVGVPLIYSLGFSIY
jgi:pilus assembly protein TadC